MVTKLKIRILVSMLIKKLEELKNVIENAENHIAFLSDGLEPGFLVQKDQGLWKFITVDDASNIEPPSFPYIYPHVYRVEPGNKIPRKTEYNVSDVTVNYADQLVAFRLLGL